MGINYHPQMMQEFFKQQYVHFSDIVEYILCIGIVAWSIFFLWIMVGCFRDMKDMLM